jgi:hypothetical protein
MAEWFGADGYCNSGYFCFSSLLTSGSAEDNQNIRHLEASDTFGRRGRCISKHATPDCRHWRERRAYPRLAGHVLQEEVATCSKTLTSDVLDLRSSPRRLPAALSLADSSYLGQQLFPLPTPWTLDICLTKSRPSSTSCMAFSTR